MNKPAHPVSVTILGKEYKIACAPDEKEALIRSAAALDKQMHKIRDTGKVSGADRIAVLAALNLAAQDTGSSTDFSTNDSAIADVCDRIQDLRLKIEKALENS
ncbi:MAG: hypothetical protein RL563_211 [Pseudomonadota bacterium]|jgi:cell division protein ZapA